MIYFSKYQKNDFARGILKDMCISRKLILFNCKHKKVSSLSEED